MNVLIVDQPPCYRSSIEDSIRLGVSNQHKTQALNYLRTKTISFCRKLGLNYANKITCKNLSNTVTPQIPVSSEIIFCTSHLAAPPTPPSKFSCRSMMKYPSRESHCKESNIYHRPKPDGPTTYQRHVVWVSPGYNVTSAYSC